MKLGPYELDQIYTGDARELAKAIPDESVDLILCDPVYWNIGDYEWLARFAEHALFNGGNVIAQAGSGYRYDAETAMRQTGLIPFPLLAEVYDFAKGGYFYKYGVVVGWKPHIWFAKGSRRNGQPMFDRVYSDRCDKQWHLWGDSSYFFGMCVMRLTEQHGIVLDPFTGGGTVPAVCKMLGRHYLAFEIDPDTAERARQRVANTQPPLFVPQLEQLELEAMA